MKITGPHLVGSGSGCESWEFWVWLKDEKVIRFGTKQQAEDWIKTNDT